MAVLSTRAQAAALLSLLSFLAVARAVSPTVSGTPSVLGNMQVLYPALDRDSCGSTRFGKGELWTCRDTELLVDGAGTLAGGFVTNSASWSFFDGDGSPQLNMSASDMKEPFYPIPAGDCRSSSGGMCDDGTRYTVWPDSPVLTTLAYPNGYAQGYTWITSTHLNSELEKVTVASPATSLYRVVYDPTKKANKLDLPAVTLVSKAFWPANSIPYGTYGSLINGSTAYLYGLLSSGAVALAKVDVSSIDDASRYQYYVDRAWTAARPGLGDDGAAVENAGNGGQGTFYYSPHWASYVWIGGSVYPGSQFNIATAPLPEGPWTTPTAFYTAPNGNASSLPSYSLQAHPGMTDGTGKDIYLSYTRTDTSSEGDDFYSTPLVHVVWA